MNDMKDMKEKNKEDKKIRMIGIGIATMDVYCHQKRMYPGGNEYNIAYHAKQQGAEAGFMGIFANDMVGQILEETLVKEGIDTSHSHHETGSSGYALVDIKDGDRVFLDWNKKGVTDLYPFEFTSEEMAYISGYDVVCISWGARVSKEKIQKLYNHGIHQICYDFYDNFTEQDILDVAPYIEYAFFSCSHISEQETEAILKKAVSLGCKIAVGTRGGNPTMAYDGNEIYQQEICKVKATDTMGAGDSYISAFLYQYLTAKADGSLTAKDNINQSLQKAAQFAATIVVKDGALGVGYDVDPQKLGEIINL